MKYKIKELPFIFEDTIDIKDCNTAKQAIIKSNLNWEVEKGELIARMPAKNTDKDKKYGFIKDGLFYDICPNAYCIFRKDINKPIAVVKDKYTIVQNINAFTFFNDCIGYNKANFISAYGTEDNRKIFLSAILPNKIILQNDIIDLYFILSTSHDTSEGIRLMLLPVSQKYNIVYNANIGNNNSFISFRHTNNVHNKITNTTNILIAATNASMLLKKYYDEFYNQKVDKKEVINIFALILFTKTELDTINKSKYTYDDILSRNYNAIEECNISTKKVNTFCNLYYYYFNGINQLENVGTLFGVYNAVCGYYTHCSNDKNYMRMNSLLYGDKSKKIELCGNIILNKFLTKKLNF